MKKITGLMAMLAVAGALAAPVMAADRDDYGRGRDEVRRTVVYTDNCNYGAPVYQGYTAHRDVRGRLGVRPVARHIDERR
jgi:hypothetical protein